MILEFYGHTKFQNRSHLDFPHSIIGGALKLVGVNNGVCSFIRHLAKFYSTSFFYLVSAFWDVYLIVSVFGVQYKYQLFFHKSTPSTSSNGAHSGWSSAVFNKNFSLQPSLQSAAFSSATPVGRVNLHNSFAQSSWVGSVNSQLIRSIFQRCQLTMCTFINMKLTSTHSWQDADVAASFDAKIYFWSASTVPHSTVVL